MLRRKGPPQSINSQGGLSQKPVLNSVRENLESVTVVSYRNSAICVLCTCQSGSLIEGAKSHMFS
jgi:hypothetical protein